MWKSIQKLSDYGNFLVLLITLVGAYIAIDTHYAKAEEFKKLELRLEQKITYDRMERVQERMWKLEDRYPQINTAPPEIKDQYRQLDSEYKTLNNNLTTIQQRMEN